MFETLTFFHSIFRWLVLASLLSSICSAYAGFTGKKPFGKGVNALRHWTATIAHVQLILGIYLYLKSPVTNYFLHETATASAHLETLFFGLLHPLVMFTSVVLITVGSALAKRKAGDAEKFKTMLTWFSVALLLILIFIPWPFSPFAHRPYIR